MPKLYVFAIGGTGSRVLRSLTMLMAAGVSMKCHEVVPIIIDPDQSNGNLTQTVTLMNHYAEVHNSLSFEQPNASRFFGVKMNRALNNYTLNIKDTSNKTFDQFIGLDGMDKANAALARVLFSKKNLGADMNVGFKGNPNMGSVVLNQIVASDDFMSFANSFQQGDKIFIISSIFGGTGASGFPLLLKTLRTNKTLPNFKNINDAPIGAVTILPYFQLETNEESAIDSSTFVSKARSALAYYEDNVKGENGVNDLYFLGDTAYRAYANVEGGCNQTNLAHNIEVMAATAIVDFDNKREAKLDGMPTQYHELGINDVDDTKAIDFTCFHNELRAMLAQPLTQFSLMTYALLSGEMKKDYLDANRRTFVDFYHSKFYRALEDYLRDYAEWLGELEQNTPALHPFNLNSGTNPFDMVVGIPPKQKGWFHFGSQFNEMGKELNQVEKKLHTENLNERFMQMYAEATANIIKNKLPLN